MRSSAELIFSLCICALLAPSPLRASSYFSPELGRTVNIDATSIPRPVTNGLPRNMAILCADPKTVIGLVDGKRAWKHKLDYYPTSMQFFDGLLYYSYGHQSIGGRIRVVDPRTGIVKQEWKFPHNISAIWLGHTDRPVVMVSYEKLEENNEFAFYEGSVEVFPIANKHSRYINYKFIKPIHSIKEYTYFPRSILIDDGKIYIADTFNNKVKIVNLETGELDNSVPFNSTDSFYPNNVHLMPDKRVLLTGEHSNRVILWNPQDNSREVVLSAPVAPFNNALADMQYIRMAIPKTAALAPDYHPAYSPPKQITAQEYWPGEISLYSPNQAFYEENGNLAVVDTDNARILVLDAQGKVETEITNLNNPVRVAFFD